MDSRAKTERWGRVAPLWYEDDANEKGDTHVSRFLKHYPWEWEANEAIAWICLPQTAPRPATTRGGWPIQAEGSEVVVPGADHHLLLHRAGAGWSTNPTPSR